MGNEIQSIADIVRVHGAGRPDQVALVQDDRTLTWAELYERAQKMANLLASLGVGPEDRVAMLEKNGIEHFEVFFGAALLNAVCVDVNWRLAPPEVEYIVDDAGAKVFVVGADFVPVLDAIEPNLTTVKRTLVIGRDYAEALAAAPTGDPGNQSATSDVAFQLYSSGTTGRPKGVLLSNANLVALVSQSIDTVSLDETSVNLVAMPLFHIGGGGWATAGMWTGCKSIIVRDLDPAKLVELFAEAGITNAFLVPAVLQFMLGVPEVADHDYPALRSILYGASPISEAVLAGAIATFRCDFIQAYGLTETTGTIVNLRPEDHHLDGPRRHLLRSCGKPCPGTVLRIVDTDTQRECEVGEVGEIWARGPQIMKGYWNMPEETAKSITDGWFHTGDAGYLDADGYLYIHDRVKDMIVSGAENVYPAEVENVLMGIKGVADVAVIGVPDERWGETAKAMIVRSPDEAGVALTEQAVIDHARQHLAKFKCPTSVDWVDALPRNPSGKILKKELRAPFWEGRERNVN
ncbi:MAG: long-chain-fatty-acid--CoA ligase [Ilumatobacteraceae bacterium]